ncbi:MAG TPA: aldo/keto reductase [Terriglobales bacterium]|nr:aldo/keto reductase [Terriglobales bacterium]
MIPGFATADGTERYSARFSQLRNAGHFRRPEDTPGPGDLRFSSLGLGTYLGEPDDASDQLYTQAVETALLSGINVIDSAINYRHQRSERSVGAALQNLIGSGVIQRDEVILCTKAGYLSFDGAVPADPRAYFMKEYVESGVLNPSEVAGGMHCMAPRYLENQLERSRKNLGLETVDVFYVHNPESQLGEVPREMLYSRLKDAFTAMEKFVQDGKIRWYGIASWNSFRVSSSEQPFISLATCLDIAQQVAGDRHHFRFVQLPFNLGMPEAFALPVQSNGDRNLSPLEFLQTHGIAGIASASLYQGQLAHDLPAWLTEKLGMSTDAERALQFARSAPGILTALVGMGKPAHVHENIRTALSSPLTTKAFDSIFATG